MKAELSEKTIKTAIEGIEEHGYACLPDLLKVIQALTANVQSLSIYRLSELIKNDTVVLAKVFSAANTVGYHPIGDPVITIQDAIQVIGFDRLRSLILSLILLESSQRHQVSEFEKKAVAESLCAGMVAQAFAPEVGLPKSEDAFVAASLRGFGSIVLSTYLTEAVSEVYALSGEMSLDSAYVEVLGLTPVDLSIHLLDHMGMGKAFQQILRGSAMANQAIRPTKEMLLAALVEASGQLSQVIVDPTLDVTRFDEQAQKILSKHLKSLPTLPKLLSGALESSERHLNALVRGIGRTSIASEHLQCIAARVEGKSPPEIFLTKEIALTADRSQNQDAAKSGFAVSELKVVKKVEVLQRVIETTTTEMRQGGMSLNSRNPRAASHRLLKVVSEMLAAPECWCFLPVAGKEGYLLFESIGVQAFGLQGRVNITVTERTVFGVCLKRGENVIINNAREQSIRNYLPRWFLQNVDFRSFLLLPLVNDKKRFGLILAAWPTTDPTSQITPHHYKLLKSFFQSILS